MKFNLLFCGVFIFNSLLSLSQLDEKGVREIAATGSESELVSESSSLIQQGYLFYAEILVDKLLKLKPESANYNYRKGYLSLHIRKDHLVAIEHLEKAIVKTAANYDMYSPKESSAPTDAFFHLATAYHLNEQIDLAIKMYEKYKLESNKKSELLLLVDMRLKQCENAKLLIKNPSKATIKNIGPTINSNEPEYSPVISPDGTALYFTSRRKWPRDQTDVFRDLRINQYPEDIYVSFMDENQNWLKPKRMEFCKAERNEATISISPDERTIYLYEDSTGNGDIYYTEFFQSKFQDIKRLEIKNINTDYWETHSVMSSDGKSFYFVSDRPGGLGGRDIYVIKRLDKANWSDPINLGPNVNGPYDEDAPFISVDNQTLYFATNDERSMGGFDIMKSTLKKDDTWSKAINVGYPINSTNDDIFYTTTLDGRRGYMTSYRNDGYGEKDIYEIHYDHLIIKDLAVLNGIIKTVNDKPLPENFAIDIKLVCIDCDQSKGSKLVYPRLRDGFYITGLQPCKTYKLEYITVGDAGIIGSESFTTICDTSFQKIEKEILVDVDNRSILFPTPINTVNEIKPNKEIDLPEVEVSDFNNLEFQHYFAYNINKISVNKGKLHKFIKEIEKQLELGRESITVNIYSSASHVPTKTYGSNDKLTKIRAENVKYDLISYFEKNNKYKGRVNVVIVSTIVQGPEYDADAKDKEKYFPYQYVGLKTE